MTIHESVPDTPPHARAVPSRSETCRGDGDRHGDSDADTKHGLDHGSLGLPPLPTLRPLPSLRPLAPMPPLPSEAGAEPDGGAATATPPTPAAPRIPVPPPPPAGHPAAHGGAGWQDGDRRQDGDGRLHGDRRQDGDGVSARTAVPAQRTHPTPPTREGSGPADPGPKPAVAPGSGTTAGPRPEAAPEIPSSAAGRIRRVLVLGGADPLDRAVTAAVTAAGHHLALLDASPPPGTPRHSPGPGPAPGPGRGAVRIPGDRTDVEDMARVVRTADRALSGLDTLVILPGPSRPSPGLDADGVDWADLWSDALACDVLAPACAAHAAARLFLADGRAGRIVIVTGRPRPEHPAGPMTSTVADAAVTALGAELAATLEPQGIPVSVVAAGPAGVSSGAARVADLVAALLSTPVPVGVTARV